MPHLSIRIEFDDEGRLVVIGEKGLDKAAIEALILG